MLLEQQILDIYDDIHLEKTLIKIAHLVPKHLRDKDFLDFEDRKSCEDQDFALCIKTKTGNYLRKYPIKTDIDTYLSAKYLEMNHTKLPEQAAKIATARVKIACDKFNIPFSNFLSHKYETEDDYPEINNFYNEIFLKKTANSNQDILHEPNSSYKALNNKYPINTIDELRKADQYFDKYASQFSPFEKHEYSKNVVNRANTLGYEVYSSELKKYAGVNGYNHNLPNQIDYRCSLTDSYNCKLEYSNLKKEINKIHPIEFSEKLAKADKNSGLDKHYGKKIHDNYAATFSSSKSENSKNENLNLETLLSKSKREKLISYLGENFVKNLEENKDNFFDTLSEDVKEIVLLIENGSI